MCYPQRDGQRYCDVLRDILRVALGIPCWIEVSVCRSFLQYRALNAHWTLRSGIDWLDEVSWWIVNSSHPPRYRRDVHPAKWYLCRDYRRVGRTEIHADYDLWTLRAGSSSGLLHSYRPLSPLVMSGVTRGILHRGFVSKRWIASCG